MDFVFNHKQSLDRTVGKQHLCCTVFHIQKNYRKLREIYKEVMLNYFERNFVLVGEKSSFIQ